MINASPAPTSIPEPTSTSNIDNTSPINQPATNNPKTSSKKPVLLIALIFLFVIVSLCTVLSALVFMATNQKRVVEITPPSVAEPTVALATSPTYVPPTPTIITQNTFESELVPDFSFTYPTDWELSVSENQIDLDPILKVSTINLSKRDHTLTFILSSVLMFGGETDCFKNGQIDYEFSGEIVRVNKDINRAIEPKSFAYYSNRTLFDRTHNSEEFYDTLSVWTPGNDDDNEYIACGVLGVASVRRTIYSYSDLTNLPASTFGDNPSAKIPASIDIIGTYSGERADQILLEEMDTIVSSALANDPYSSQ